MVAHVNETPASTSPGGLKSQIYIAPQISALSYPDIAESEFKIIVGVSESVSHIEGKIINKYQVSVVPKAAAASAA
jgi:hypothetical protein